MSGNPGSSCINIASRYSRASKGLTDQQVNYAYKQAQMDILGRTDLCPAAAGFAITKDQADVTHASANPLGLSGGSAVPYNGLKCKSWCKSECNVGNQCCGTNGVPAKVKCVSIYGIVLHLMYACVP